MYFNTSLEQLIDDEYFDELNKKMARSMLATLIYISLLMILGVVGNTMVFLVYYQRFKPSATRTYILVMSVFDLLANVTSLPGEILDIRFAFTFDLPWLCRIFRSLNSFLTLVSAAILVAVARDRHRKICQPLLTQQNTLGQLGASLAACIGFALALTIPFGILNGRHTISTGVTNVTGVTCSIDDAFVSTPFPMAYNALMALAFVSCVAIMVTSYAGVGRQLWRHRKSSKNVTRVNPTGQGRPNFFVGGRGGWQKPSYNNDDDTTTSDTRMKSAVSELPASSSNSDIDSSNRLPKSQADNQWRVLFVKPSNDEACNVRLLGGQSRSQEMLLSDTSNMAAGPGPRPICLRDESSTAINMTQDSTVTTAAAQHDHDSTSGELINETSFQVTANGTKRLGNGKPSNSSLTKSIFRTHSRKSSSLAKTDKKQGRRLTRSRGSMVKKIPKSTTMMMFVLTAVFIVNYLPHLLIIIARAVSDDVGKGLEGWELNIYNIALRSYFVNCAVNPLVYSFCSARFRQECGSLVLGKAK
ncbi:hypothetical protein C0Q70_07332 [Pomacea canaliculata]|uniref:G-protein coupled receptors family 1 profile domain-containing protein n=2 Tax=Pomacea canaliculata TaxID=400727 RepID=A0A2T7PER9_POMCA|nr:hypothetical protein C0Q70_07332 [Pomacea canaliculata]